jgi:hypothetical protein
MCPVLDPSKANGGRVDPRLNAQTRGGRFPPADECRKMSQLANDELRAILAVAAPIPIQRRAHFLEIVGARVAGLREPGPGAIHRILRDVQQQFGIEETTTP